MSEFEQEWPPVWFHDLSSACALSKQAEPERRLNGEVTRLNCEGQFKPFVYLNGGDSGREYLRSGVDCCDLPRCGNERPRPREGASGIMTH